MQLPGVSDKTPSDPTPPTKLTVAEALDKEIADQQASLASLQEQRDIASHSGSDGSVVLLDHQIAAAQTQLEILQSARSSISS